MRSVLRVVFVAFLFCCGPVCAAAGRMLRLSYADIESFPYKMGNGEQISDLRGVSIEVIRQAADPYIAGIGLTEVEKLRTPSAANDYFLNFSLAYAEKRRAR